MKKTMLIVILVGSMSILMAACSNREQLKVIDNTITEEKTNVAQVKLDQEQKENNSANSDTAAEAEVSSDYTTINIVKLTKEEIELKKENMKDPNTSIRYGIEPAEYGIPAGENGTSFSYFADGSNAHFSADDNPDIQLDTDDPVEIAKAYVQLYDSWKWSGSPTTYNGHQVYFYDGEIEIDDVPTGVKCNEGILYDKAKTAYLTKQWDGTLAMLDSHYIELSREGYVLIDGYLGGGQENLDLPESAYELLVDEIPNYKYVPGQGTYAIIDKKLVKFLREEQITLPGEELSWKGFQAVLIYNEIDGKLYLISRVEMCPLDNSENYVYVFDDCNISKMTYLGKVDFEHQYPGDVDIKALINQNK